MPVDRSFIERSLQRIVEEEERTILRKLSDVDTVFIKSGHGGGSSRWTMERHRVTEEEVSRAADRMMSEIRGLAGKDAAQFAEDGAAAVGHLGQLLLNHYRAGLGPTKEGLIEALAKVKERTRDDLTYRPVQPTPAPGSLAGRDININATGPVAIAGQDAHQHVEGFDAAGLLDVLAKVKDMVEASKTTSDVRVKVSDEITGIEHEAAQAHPDVSRISRLMKRLGGTLKEVGLPVAAGVAEAYVKQRLGFS
jgi:hypothetical protein